MISLDSGQKQLASRDSTAMITLVKLVTYSDYIAETVDETFYWATLPTEYQWDGITTNRFRGFLKDVGPIDRGFPHIPNADELSIRDGMRIDLDASQWGGQFPWTRLAEKNLIGATFEIATLLVDWGAPRSNDWQDQSALGAVHVVRFRGEITEVPGYDDEGNEFALVSDSFEPVLPWAVALDSSAVSAKDLGRTYPVPVGYAKRVPLVQRQVGWVTTLVTELTETTTGNVEVSDTTGFPDDPTAFGVWIGTERLVAVKVDEDTINITGRGTLAGVTPTVAQNHNGGSVMIEEIEEAKFVYSGVENRGLEDLYARSPHNGELIKVPHALFGFLQADKDLDSGIPLGVVSFTPQLWAGLIALLNKEASVTVQPTVATDGVETIQIPFGSYGHLASVTSSVNCDITGNPLGVNDGNVVMDYSAGPKQAAVLWCTSAAVPQQARTVVRFRVVWNFRIESNASVTTRLEYELSMLNHTQTNTLLATLVAGPTVSYQTTATAWFTPSPDATLADLVNAATTPPTSGNRAIAYLDQTAGGSGGATAVAIKSTSFVEVELDPLPVDVTTNVETTGAAELGFNLDLFGDIQGAETLGSESSEDEFDDEVGITGANCTIAAVGGPTDGFKMTGTGVFTDRSGTVAPSPTLDLTNARMRFDYLIPAATMAMLTQGKGALFVTLVSSGGSRIWGFPKSSLYDTTWREFTFDPNTSWPNQTSASGTLDMTTITQIKIGWITLNNGDIGEVSIRDLRIEQRTHHTHPIDIAQWLIEENLGLTGGADATTFATAKTNLPGVTFAGDLRQAGGDLGEVLARLGFECRTNFAPSEASGGTVYKAFNALATYAYSASARTLGDFNSLQTQTKQLDEQPTEFIGVYDFRNQFDRGAIEGYAALLQANTTTNDISTDVPTADITDAQARVGVRASDPLPFFLVESLASMVEVFAYFVQEALRGDAKRYSMNVPYSLGYDLEPGEIVEFTPRWASSAIKCRLIKLTFPFDRPAIGLNLEEVL